MGIDAVGINRAVSMMTTTKLPDPIKELPKMMEKDLQQYYSGCKVTISLYESYSNGSCWVININGDPTIGVNAVKNSAIAASKKLSKDGVNINVGEKTVIGPDEPTLYHIVDTPTSNENGVQMTMVIYLPELMGFENVNKVNRSVGSDSSNNGSNKIDPGNGLY